MTIPYSAIAAPAAGVYHGVPEAEYHSWPYLSNSRMTTLYESSAAHLRYEIDNHGNDDTPDKLIGRACHKAILEPREFTDAFFRAGKHDRRTKEGKAAYERDLTAAGGRQLLVGGDYDTVMRCRDSVLGNRRFQKILEKTPPQSRELSVVWKDKETGVMCKARIDLACMHPSYGMIADLKSTQCAARAAFAKSIVNYGYHRQAPWYLEGLSYHDTFLPHFCFVAFEKQPPFANAIYRIDDDSMRLGAEQIKRLKRQYAQCLESGKWPAYPEHISDITLPDWSKRQIEMEVATL